MLYLICLTCQKPKCKNSSSRFYTGLCAEPFLESPVVAGYYSQPIQTLSKNANILCSKMSNYCFKFLSSCSFSITSVICSPHSVQIQMFQTVWFKADLSASPSGKAIIFSSLHPSHSYFLSSSVSGLNVCAGKVFCIMCV